AAAIASQLRLEPLSRVEAATMLRELAGELPDRVRELVLDRAEGNPFFIEEALASLLDRGVLRAAAGAWTAADIPADLPMPDSVQAMLAARVDLLPASDRQALQAAAVIGRSFWEGAVRELTDGQCPDLEL